MNLVGYSHNIPYCTKLHYRIYFGYDPMIHRLLLPGELAKHAVSEGTKAGIGRACYVGGIDRAPLKGI